MRTANPALQAFTKPQTWADFQRGDTTAAPAEARPRTMTYGGTLTATAILLGIASAVAVATWHWLSGRTAPLSQAFVMGVFAVNVVGGFVLGLVMSFKPQVSPFVAPVFAACQGVFLGLISWAVPQYFKVDPGIVLQAIGLTLGVSGGLLAAYSAGLVRLGSTATKIVVVATSGVMIYYLGGWILSMFGLPVLSLGWKSGMIGIGFSLFVVVLASLNLVLDFQFIQAGVTSKAPRYMEWYGAFGLMVTLVWLYVELLRLLAKLQSRD